MESITTTTLHLPKAVIPSTPAANGAKFNTQEGPSSSTQSKQLQPDRVVISAEATEKSADEEKQEKTNIDASSLSKNMTAEEAASSENSEQSELDKRIQELSMEILELTVKIQMLQDKEDKESVKERQKLEVDLAIKKGELEAAMDRKLQLATLS